MYLSGSTPYDIGKESMQSLLVCRQESEILPLHTSLASANLNYAWACALVEGFVALGGRQVVLCPGSRNTPLILAFAEHPKLVALSALDERSAAFFALGLAKRSRLPVALVCTSGTAVANFYPAVMEAYQAHVPLLVLTADRPGVLRYCSARQTVNQLDVFGRFARFCVELALPEARIGAFAYLRQTLLQAYEKALTPDPGPVHLNIPLDEPLDPKVDPGFQAFWQELQASRALLTAAPPLISELALDASALAPVFQALLAAKKGLIVLGSWQDETNLDAFSESLRTLSTLLPWPILADVTSPARYLKDPLEAVISAYDYCLAEPALAPSLQPDLILQLGPLPNSQRLNRYVGQLDAPTYLLNPYSDNRDPHHRQTQHLRLSLAQFVKALGVYLKALGSSCQALPSPRTKADSAFPQLWKRADALAQKVLKVELDAENTLFDGKVPYELARILMPKTQVVLANSRTVRNAEQFFFASDREYRVYFNGGVNGSDGITSTALGIAHGSDAPTVLITGDLAFLHDSNALLLSQTFRGSLTIVIVNNNGGGLFHQLPIAQYPGVEKAFETYITTPQAVEIADLAKAYGVSYKRLESWDDLRLASFDGPGIHLLELKTSRIYDAAYHSRLFRTVSTQLRSLLSPVEGGESL